VLVNFFVFERSLYAHYDCITFIKNTAKNRNILQNKLQYEITLIYLNIFLNGIYSYDGKAEFSPIITPDITYMILCE